MAEPCLQLRLVGLIARFAQEGVHILLIGLPARLVEGIDPQQIAGQAAGILKEIDQFPHRTLVPAGGPEMCIRDRCRTI